MPTLDPQNIILFDRIVSDTLNIMVVDNQYSTWKRKLVIRKRQFDFNAAGERIPRGSEKMATLDSVEAVENTLACLDACIASIQTHLANGLPTDLTPTGRLRNRGAIDSYSIFRNGFDEPVLYDRPFVLKHNLLGETWIQCGSWQKDRIDGDYLDTLNSLAAVLRSVI